MYFHLLLPHTFSVFWLNIIIIKFKRQRGWWTLITTSTTTSNSLSMILSRIKNLLNYAYNTHLHTGRLPIRRPTQDVEVESLAPAGGRRGLRNISKHLLLLTPLEYFRTHLSICLFAYWDRDRFAAPWRPNLLYEMMIMIDKMGGYSKKINIDKMIKELLIKCLK